MLSILLTTAALGAAPAQSGGTPGTLVISLPSDAKLYVDDNPTSSTGSLRRLATPPLRKTGSYTLRAEVTRNGEVISQERTVRVNGGQQARVQFDFSNPNGTLRGGSGGFNPGPGGSGGGLVTPGGGGSVNPGGLSGGGSDLPPTPGGGKIVQKMVRDPKTGKYVPQKYIVYPDGSKKLLPNNSKALQNYNSGGSSPKSYTPKGTTPKGKRSGSGNSNGTNSGGNTASRTISNRTPVQSYRPPSGSSYRPPSGPSYRPSGGGGGRGRH